MNLNHLQKLMVDLGISDPNSFTLFHKGVRDNPNIDVLRCDKSGIIVLETLDHVQQIHYETQEGLSYWNATTIEEAHSKTQMDDKRRASQFGHLLENVEWLDFGCGLAGLLEHVNWANLRKIHLVELQKYAREYLCSKDHHCVENVQQIADGSIDIVTLFHVLEHLPHPVQSLKQLTEKIRPGGKIIVEVPCASDILIHECQPFREFTLWSEHLILHTGESLHALLEHCGLKQIRIEYYSRYPFSNHFHWLTRGKPGGHVLNNPFSTSELDGAYSKMLIERKVADTLIATAIVN